jgi:phosphatidylglycerophosphate synthase
MENTGNRYSGFEFGGLDTTIVLFFLTLEYGRAVEMLSLEGVVMGITILMVLVLPYFLPSLVDRPALGSWLIGRGAVAMIGMLLGVGLSRWAGNLLPEGVAFLPMTFLILASMISCFVQFYSVMKLRLAK